MLKTSLLGTKDVFVCASAGFKYFRDQELRRIVGEKVGALQTAKNNLERKLQEKDHIGESKRQEILKKPFNELLSFLQDGKYTATEVLHAYQAKALEVDKQTNCIIDILEEAEQWATELDKATTKGPLHGIPFSVKDNFCVKNYDCTLGLIKRLNKPEQETAKCIEFLRASGAVPFVKTNVPQTLHSFHCGNPVFGLTSNPFDPTRTSGGSSGGEAALVSLGGSVVGIAADLGGSLRIPAHMCGIYCLKPTYRRVSGVRARKTIEGVVGVVASSGPMCREVDGIVGFMRTLLSKKMFDADPSLAPIPFQEDLYQSKRPLKIGYYDDDGLITPTPGCQRAVHEAKAILEKNGHKLIPFTVPDPWNAYIVTFNLALADGQRNVYECWKGELIEESMRLNCFILGLPTWSKKLIAHIVRIFSARTAVVLSETGRNAYQLWQDMYARRNYIEKFYDLWKDLELDALLAPGFAMPAPPHDVPATTVPALFTTLLFSLLNFPTGSVPITKENEQDQRKLKDYRNDDMIFTLMKKATEGATGMPIGVQIASLPWKDELVLRLMKELENGKK